MVARMAETAAAPVAQDDDEQVPMTYRPPKWRHRLLRREAFDRGCAMSDIINEALALRDEQNGGHAPSGVGAGRAAGGP